MLPIYLINERLKVVGVKERIQQGFVSKWCKIQVTIIKDGIVLNLFNFILNIASIKSVHAM
jgi:hypothetical protein